MKTVAFHTLGCKVNLYDTESMMQLFQDSGYQIVDFKDQADVYVINTCTVTHEGARKSRQIVRQAKKRNPSSIVAVVGCYVQVAQDEVLQIEGVDLISGTKSRHRLVEMVEAASKSKETLNIVGKMEEIEEFEELPIESYKGRTRASIKIEDGCNQYCSYCIIPYARGPVRSRKPGNTVKEVVKLVEAGVREIVLTGIHLGAYGSDTGSEMNLAELLHLLIPISGLARIRLSSIEITEIDDQLLSLIASEEKICPHLHLPLQAGSNQILEKMNRPYTTMQFHERVRQIREQVPDIAITTDVMVGFPGETEKLFHETYEFIKKINFAQLHVFKYSKRHGTPAAEMINQVSSQDKNERSQRLRQLGNYLTKEYNRIFLGKILPVLVEEVPDLNTKMLTGVTPNYIKVYLTGNIDELKGKIVPVKLLKLNNNLGVFGEVEQNFSMND